MLSVLVVSPDPAVPGGVSVFVESMKRHAAQSRMTSFYIGSMGRPGEPHWRVAWRLLSAPARLAWHVLTHPYDVVHLNPTFDAKSLIRDGLLLLKLRGIFYRRTLVYFHGWDFAVQERIAGHKGLRWLTGWMLNGAGLITVLGDEFREGLIALGVAPNRVIVTRTMFDGAGLHAVQNEAPASSRPFILYMSRFDREKGGRELLQAFASLQRPDIDLVMAGEGEDADFLRGEAARLGLAAQVRFTGYVTGADKWRLLRDCILFALPTYYRSEGMPVVVLEAMGAGKPLLVGSAGALKSVVRDGENGVVLGEINPRNVETGLRLLLDDEMFASAAGKRNAELAWSQYEAGRVTNDIENLYAWVARC
ncbi:MAG: glycosyltransferase family 4 protein [Alphaproteobacteria bacterium]|nr:glycosyltransferase family 4 protein [Alphaproteobacteria bacterium]